MEFQKETLCVSKCWYPSTGARPGSRYSKARRPPAAADSPAPAKKGAPKVDDDWRVGELYIERRGRRSIVGNVYKGRVDNVLGGMEAAFVDIGLEKNGFLHVDEIVTPGGQTHRRGRGRGGGPQISDLLKAGQEIVVQVTKDPIGTKGARLSMEVSIPGRYLVYVPDGDGVGVSRRLPDKERERLRKLASGLKLKDAGLIIRTAAVGARKSDMERELQYLFRLHEVLQSRVEESRGADDGLPGGGPADPGRPRRVLEASSSAR